LLLNLDKLLGSRNFPDAPAETTRRVTLRGKRDGEEAAVSAPPEWSDEAVKIVAEKYFAPGEDSVGQMVRRVTGAIREFAVASGRLTGPEANVLANDVEALVLSQAAAFNSPVWFNVGRRERPQSSACFILGLEDDMQSIAQVGVTEAMLYKQGSGSGVSYSPLRPAGAPLSGGGKASGPVSFMRGHDAMAGAVKSGGQARRAAKMAVLDLSHADAEEFIRCKWEAERRAHALVDAGFDPHFDHGGGAYDSVHFQNANHSLRVTDEQMSLALEVPDHRYVRLLRLAAEAAHFCGDPGLQFDGPIQREHVVPSSGRINASNPCSEFLFLDDSACNLASLNLMAFRGADGVFQHEAFARACQVMLVAMELLVDMSGYPTAEIAENSRRFRPLGLGYANLGGLLVSLGLAYDSDAGRSLAGAATALMSASAWYTSAQMAKEWGSFPGLEDGRNHEALGEHSLLLLSRAEKLRGPLSREAHEAAVAAHEGVLAYGARNAQTTLLAPTGTIAFMMDCETTGVEPPVRQAEKDFVGGGSAQVGTSGSKCERLGIERLGIADPSQRPDVFCTAIGEGALRPEAHVLMVASVQRFLDGGVSKTVNMPQSSTPEHVLAVFELAWRTGCKSIAVYRDGSKRSQPLNAGTRSVTVGDGRRRLPETRPGVNHKFVVGGVEGYLNVGLYPDTLSPGEMFIRLSKAGSTVSGWADAMSMMMSIALQRGAPLEELLDKLQGTTFEPNGVTQSSDEELRFASSVPDYVARWMRKRFLSDAPAAEPQPDGHVCGNCGSGNVVRSGTCLTCRSCGTSQGGCG
jgi:ribonucleoside-diphosphate reductase alpha chain